MEHFQFDLSAQDLNPTFLFGGKIERTTSEDNYHTHDFPEIGIILKGSGTYHVNDEYVPVREGDVLVFNPGIAHESVIYSPKEHRTEFFVGFTDVEFRGMKKNHIELETQGKVLHLMGANKRAIFRICEEMEKENQARHPGQYFMLKAYLIQLLLNLVRGQVKSQESAAGREFKSAAKTYAAAEVADYLEKHYEEKISLDRIAENMYLSPFYISRIFKSEIGESPIHYLIRVRLEHAKDLLQQGSDLTIAQIAGQVGYEDVYHFSKLFKKEYGLSPSKFRKENG